MEYYVPCDYEEVSAGSSTAVGLTAAKIASCGVRGQARLMATAYPFAWLEHGVAPTSATVQQLAVGGFVTLETLEALQNFLAIGIGGTSVIAVQYYRYIRQG